MEADMIRTRFAPSPNGSLHLGHAYAAIVAHDLGRRRGGERQQCRAQNPYSVPAPGHMGPLHRVSDRDNFPFLLTAGQHDLEMLAACGVGACIGFLPEHPRDVFAGNFVLLVTELIVF